MENHSNTTKDRPSVIGTFFRKGFSGAATGALMSVIVAGVSMVGGAAFWTTLGSVAAVVIPATALFSGIMAAKHIMFDQPRAQREMASASMIPVPVAGITAPIISQSQEAALENAEHAPAKNWVATTSRGADSQSRVQHILDQGMADKDRAQAILAAREAASAEPSQRPM